MSVHGAKWTPSGGLLATKADSYVEVTVEGGGSTSIKKTAVKKKTNRLLAQKHEQFRIHLVFSPDWEEFVNVTVTEHSTVCFKILNKSKLFEDSLVGTAKLKVNQAPTENGECKFRTQN